MSGAIAGLAALVLGLAAALHVYWAAGGRAGVAVAVPERQGRPLFRPGRGATLLVAFALFLAAALLAGRGGWWPLARLPGAAWAPWACWLLAAVFLARGIGDFRHVGLFKPNCDSRFARLDSRVYSPLCLLLGLASAVAALQ